MKSQLIRAIGLVVISIGLFAATLISGNAPLLGLDLQGGVSVVYQPTGNPTDEALDEATSIIRGRVDALGVAEPEISRQGNTIVVDLPGVEQQQRALDLVGQTAELRFRPVLVDLGVVGLNLEEGDGDADPTTDTTTTTVPQTDSGQTDTGDTEEGLAPLRRNRQTDDGGGEDPTDPAEPTEGDPAEPVAESTTLSALQLEVSERCFSTLELTEPEEDIADRVVLLRDESNRWLCLGPTLLTGTALETASAGTGAQGWQVNPVFREGPDGIDLFNAAAALCNAGAEACPPTQTSSVGRLAIVLDGIVQSAPSINSSFFSRNQIEITGAFTPEEATDLATALKFGALPVELEAQQIRTISASIGTDVLESGLIAGLIGLALVAIFLIAYYRLAGLIAIGGLLISAMLLWSIVALLGQRLGLALSLSGIVGLIVAIGVSADSNIVYFENVKDAVASGKRVTTSVERAYRNSISTIIKADVVSLIAAVLLYFLTVGAVKGFALYLGVATVLDLLIAMVFMKPMLLWLANHRAVQNNPRLLGLPDNAVTAALIKQGVTPKAGRPNAEPEKKPGAPMKKKAKK